MFRRIAAFHSTLLNLSASSLCPSVALRVPYDAISVMSLKNTKVLITGASTGIGQAIAESLAQEGAHLILLARSKDKLATLAKNLMKSYPQMNVVYHAVDVGNYDAVDKAVVAAVEQFGDIDILINNAGLALDAPSPFPELPIKSIVTMNSTNVSGLMYSTYSVLNHSPSFSQHKRGTILNITSTTALEAPPFPGEAVYHANKALQEGFTNALRNELAGTDIKVLALRPGVVATHFHRQRVGYDDQAYDEFTAGYIPLTASAVAKAALYILQQPVGISIKALDIVPTAQRSLAVFDRGWNERNKGGDGGGVDLPEER